MNWKKNIAIFMLGQGLSLFGSMLVYYAILWHITLEAQSGTMMMLMTVVGTVPMFFISPFGGVWADRYNKKHLINIADGCIAIVTLIMALTFSVGIEYLGILLVCLMIRSFGQGVQMPAVNALIPEIVPAEKLIKVNGVSGTIQSMTMLVSPMVAGALLSFLPINLILFIDVITATIGIVLLYFFVKTKPVEKKETKLTYFNELKEGLRYSSKNAFIKKLFILMAIFNVMLAPVAALTPLQVARDFGPEVWRLTAIEVTFFIGSILGGLVIAVWGGFKNKSYTIAIATFMVAIGSVLLGLLTNFWIYIGCMAFAGIFMSMFNPPLMTVLQTNVDEKYMGRVFSILTMVSSIAMPVGMMIWGPLSDIIKIDWILIGTGAITFLVGFIFIFDKVLLKAGKAQVAETESSNL